MIVALLLLIVAILLFISSKVIGTAGKVLGLIVGLLALLFGLVAVGKLFEMDAADVLLWLCLTIFPIALMVGSAPLGRDDTSIADAKEKRREKRNDP